jgi:SET domain
MYGIVVGLKIYILTLLSAFVLFCHAVNITEEATAMDDMALIADIAEWVTANGGTISKKMEVRDISGSLSGLFAKEDLDEGEVIVEVPWKLVLLPISHRSDKCEKVENIRQIMAKDPKEHSPYERFLFTRKKDHIPLFWSAESKEILMELMIDFNTRGFNISLADGCDGRLVDEGFQHAFMLLQTRGEGYYGDMLVPLEDLLNHRNGYHANVIPVISAGRYVRVMTNRAVRAGEQLQNSYNRCPFCKNLYSNPQTPLGFQVTPQLFEAYGFVESIPQRWVLPEMRMILDIVHPDEDDGDDDDDDDHSVEVVYAVPPSIRGIHYLRQRLQELEEFEEEYGERTDIPEIELEGIFSLHEAIVHAYSQAVYQSVGLASEEIWLEDPTSWHIEMLEEDDGKDEL